MARLAVPLVVALAVAAAAPNAQAQAKSREPYDLAIRCFVANAVAVGDREDAGDTAKAAYYERKAKQSHGTAYLFGEALGFSQQQVTRDIEQARRTELSLMVRDRPYFHRVVAACKGMELM